MSRKLRDVERDGGVTTKWWTHDDTKITVETSQEVDPIFESVKHRSEASNPKSGFRLKATIPFTLLEETCKQEALRCGMRTHELVSEVMNGKTDRAKKIWKRLSEDRDYRKLQAKAY